MSAFDREDKRTSSKQTWEDFSTESPVQRSMLDVEAVKELLAFGTRDEEIAKRQKLSFAEPFPGIITRDTSASSAANVEPTKSGRVVKQMQASLLGLPTELQLMIYGRVRSAHPIAISITVILTKGGYRNVTILEVSY